jgi:hypothetical protein
LTGQVYRDFFGAVSARIAGRCAATRSPKEVVHA